MYMYMNIYGYVYVYISTYVGKLRFISGAYHFLDRASQAPATETWAPLLGYIFRLF